MTSSTIFVSGHTVSGSSFTPRRTQPGRQPLGFCEKHNLEHVWLSPDYFITPGPSLRSCANCGRVQKLIPEQWIDEDDQEPSHKERFDSLLTKAAKKSRAQGKAKR